MKLDAEARKHLLSRVFGLRKKREYPMPDKKHARVAKSDASHAEHLGDISLSQEHSIDRKADRVLAR